jgi:ABC-2 type transport system permease protein
MKAAFRHELRAYLHAPVAYAAIGLFILLASVYFYIDNIRTRSGDLTSLYATVGTLFLFIVPILSARVIAEERRSGMEILLLTSPTGVSGIVAGKFLALFALLAAMIALTLVFPLLLLLFTPLYPLSLFGHYAGLLLLAAAIAAFGIFASALTESQVVAAIISFVSLLALLIMRPIGTALGGTAAKALNWLSPFSRFDELGRGVFSICAVLFFAAFAFVSLFLSAVLSAGNRRSAGKRAYSYVGNVSVAVIAIVIVLFAELFPVKFDFSEGKRYSIGETTSEILHNLTDTVEIVGLFDDGKADTDYLEIRELLEKYRDASGSHISVSYVDPDRDTQAVTRLDPSETLGLRKNDFLVASGENKTRLGFQDLFQMKYDSKTSTWFNTGSAAEAAFTAAILNVTSAQSDKARLFVSPAYDLTAGELSELSSFLESGGRIGVLFDAATGDFPNWNALLSAYGITVNNDSIVNPEPLDVESADAVPLDFYGLAFPLSRSLTVTNGEVLAYSDGQAVAAVSERGGARVFVSGCAEFLTDAAKSEDPAAYIVGKYFYDSVTGWLDEKSEAPAIDVKSYGSGELQIPKYKADYIAFLTVIVLPLAIFLRGFLVWKRRRFL